MQQLNILLYSSRFLEQLKKYWLLPAVFLLSILEINKIALAQVVPDRTLPNNSVVDSTKNLTTITGGSRADTNLFHSFEEFSVISGETVLFDNALNVENIINRVTGNSISNIDGLIRTNGTANLFLINPNGIIFGSNAALDIGGSFVGSTANSIQFQDGSEFSSSTKAASPLLTVSIPIGLQIGANAGKIVVRGTGNNLAINRDSSLNRSNRSSGIQVPNGKSLALVGNNIKLIGGNLTASEGNVELWSVNRGNLSLDLNRDELNIINATSENLSYRDILLSKASSIDTSGSAGGNTIVRGQNIAIKDGSVILTDTLGSGSGGNLSVKATNSLTVSGISSQTPIFSGLFAEVTLEATGDGGNINLEASRLVISKGGQISTSTFGLGNAGNLNVTTKNIKASGISSFGPSGLFAAVAPGARGNGGNVNLETDGLKIAEGGQILTTTFGFGKGGNLNIKAKDIQVIGGTKFGPSNLASTVVKIPTLPEPVAAFLDAGMGNGGNLNLKAEKLQVADGGQISVFTTGSATAGNLIVNAKNIELSGFNQFGRSGLLAGTFQDIGDGGDLNIITDRLSIKNGAVISASNFQSLGTGIPGKGKAGNIALTARSVELNSTTSDIASGITAATNSGGGGNITLKVAEKLTLGNNSEISAETRGKGDGGSVEIFTDTLRLKDSGLVNTSTSAEGNAGRVNIKSNTITFSGLGSGVFSEVKDAATGDGGNTAITAKNFNLSDRALVSTSSNGLGDAGSIEIDADTVNLDRSKIITTATQAGGGNINLVTDFLYLDNDSELSSSVLGNTGGGGNIFIDSNYIIADRNSDIRANAVKGTGGNIDIDSEVALLSLDSEIDASSQLGLDGVVNINNLELDEQIGMVQLPDNIVDPTALISSLCLVEEGDVMAVTGKGGLLENPSQSLRGESVWEDLRALSLAERDKSSNPAKYGDGSSQIVEAKGWQVDSQGNIELLAHLPQQNDRDYWQLFNQCRKKVQRQSHHHTP
ncbi:filamentous hemagglutinin N-terminal domain-containing protein [Myxosarcina sp. GI1]|uniref:two-partner secretion domain-containing protein n=1 Tax=Myxosarcina sp. GI1 TaxID=1541065 RepID=UPI00155A12C7|nr:filamentous hemagglutinin N-terminal domain-containing protein [Myxosarcina sp. GI1]